MGEIRMKVKRLRKVAGCWYWRPSKSLLAKGFKNIALGPDPLMAAQKAQAINASVERDLHRPVNRGAEPGSVASIIRIYTSDDRFTTKAAATQATYLHVLREIERKAGRLKIALIERPQLRDAYRQIKARGAGIARLHIAVWINLMNMAIEEGWRTTNPARDMGIARGPARTQVWTRDQITAFRTAAEKEGRPSIALALDLAYELGQRPGDVLRLTWSQWDGQRFVLTQQKRKARVAIPTLSNELRDRLNGMDRNGVQIVLSERTGRPYKLKAFDSAFAKLRDKAELPSELQIRDTRRTALTEAGDGGGTDEQIRSLSGHRNRQSVAHYVHPSTTMAEGAQRARERAINKSGKVATKAR